jgi:hypothetical protein
MAHYSAIRKNKILPFAAKWMELEDIRLGEMSDKEKQQIPQVLSHT